MCGLASCTSSACAAAACRDCAVTAIAEAGKVRAATVQPQHNPHRPPQRQRTVHRLCRMVCAAIGQNQKKRTVETLRCDFREIAQPLLIRLTVDPLARKPLDPFCPARTKVALSIPQQQRPPRAQGALHRLRRQDRRSHRRIDKRIGRRAFAITLFCGNAITGWFSALTAFSAVVSIRVHREICLTV